MDYEDYDRLERELSKLAVEVMDENNYSTKRIKQTIQKLLYVENVAVSDDWEVVQEKHEEMDGKGSDLALWDADSIMHAFLKAGFKRATAEPLLDDVLERHPSKTTIEERVENADTTTITDSDEFQL